MSETKIYFCNHQTNQQCEKNICVFEHQDGLCFATRDKDLGLFEVDDITYKFLEWLMRRRNENSI